MTSRASPSPLLGGGRFEKRVAIVTGAGSGIGEATARLFAREGALVCLVDVNGDRATGVAQSLESEGATAMAVAADVACASDVGVAVDRVVDRWGRIDVLHNNAGITIVGSVATLSEEEWDAVIGVNVKGTFLFSRAVVPHMRRNGGGSIVNTASVSGLRPSAHRDAYSAAKGAVISLTKGMALSLAADRIRVNCVCPGTVDTELVRGVARRHFTDFAAAEEVFLKRQPLGRIGRPVDIAEAVAWLASDAAEFVTGSSLVIDGGMVLA